MMTDYIIRNYYYFRREVFGGPRPEQEELDKAKEVFLALLRENCNKESFGELELALEEIIEIADLAGFHLATRYYYKLDHPDEL